MANPTQWFEDFQKNMSEFIAKTPAADVEKNVKAFVAQGFSKLDLVTREEFDIQLAVIAKLRERVDQLEAKINELESK